MLLQMKLYLTQKQNKLLYDFKSTACIELNGRWLIC